MDSPDEGEIQEDNAGVERETATGGSGEKINSTVADYIKEHDVNEKEAVDDEEEKAKADARAGLEKVLKY